MVTPHIKNRFFYSVIYLCAFTHGLVFADEKRHCEGAIEDIETLSSPKFAGRKTGHASLRISQAYLVKRMQALGFSPFLDDFRHPHQYQTKPLVNLVGFSSAPSTTPDLLLVAHYDHLGKRGRSLYAGANDNASGVSASLHLAAILKQSHPESSIMVLLTDAEESGLYGAYAFLAEHPDIHPKHVINLDMLGTLTRNRLSVLLNRELKAQADDLKQLASRPFIATHTRALNRFHRLTGTKQINWLSASDHYAFHRAGFATAFFGGAPDGNYHSKRDTFENLDKPAFCHALVSSYEVISKLLDGIRIE